MGDTSPFTLRVTCLTGESRWRRSTYKARRWRGICPSRKPRVREVSFEAALDAAQGERWPSEPIEGELDQPRHPTQRRRIARSARLLGLAAPQSEESVERIRDHLGVAGLWHHHARWAFQNTRRLKERGQAIVGLRQRIPSGKDLVLRLLAAGSLAGLWGPVWLWDSVHQRRISLLSRATRASRAPPEPAPRIRSSTGPGPSLP